MYKAAEKFYIFTKFLAVWAWNTQKWEKSNITAINTSVPCWRMTQSMSNLYDNLSNRPESGNYERINSKMCQIYFA